METWNDEAFNNDAKEGKCERNLESKVLNHNEDKKKQKNRETNNIYKHNKSENQNVISMPLKMTNSDNDIHYISTDANLAITGVWNMRSLI